MLDNDLLIFLAIVGIYIVPVVISKIYSLIQRLATLRRDELNVSSEKYELTEARKELDAERQNLYSEIHRIESSIAERESSLTNREHQLETQKNTLLSSVKSLPYMAEIIADYETHGIELLARSLDWGDSIQRRQKTITLRNIKKETAAIVKENLHFKYQLKYLLKLYPELKGVLDAEYSALLQSGSLPHLDDKTQSNASNCVQDDTSLCAPHISMREAILEEVEALTRIQEAATRKEALKLKRDKEALEFSKTYYATVLREVNEKQEKLSEKEQSLSHREQILQIAENKLRSSTEALPYMSGIVAEYQTQWLEILARQLDWGSSVERAKKVASIREIRREAKEQIQANTHARYQLEYLKQLYPAIDDILDTEYEDLPEIDINKLSDYDKTRDWLSKEEYQQLGTIERNQLALDRYFESKHKTKWQIGRDYEIFIGYELQRSGYTVDYFGSYMGLEDLGRDLIAKRNEKILIVQCKYWSLKKQIHEKHITQLYGTLASYCVENQLERDGASAMLVTNTTLSDTAKQMAAYLGISYKENYKLGRYPCIKCNIGHNNEGERTKIYHLPFDQQYDHTKIEAPGEFFAMTVEEAENNGFRRAYKWYGGN